MSFWEWLERNPVLFWLFIINLLLVVGLTYAHFFLGLTLA